MPVTVLLFASYADAFGRRELPLDVAPGATVRDVVELVRAEPGGAALPERPAVAVNERYAAYGAGVFAGDEIAFIPPVAGG